jgi:diaminohydroxyphosphoribosylaminopyrimidine deaminase/5-amino-6-(5-phosphoribosylamino)uracil reductase
VTPRDHAALARALELAERGRHTTSPNPMVGAVVVRKGRTVAEAWHRRAGGPHAEAAALARAGSAARGGTLYVSLEPCAHTGRTPPCVDAIVASGVRKVVAAAPDPHRVSGDGFRRLRRAGVEVVLARGELRRAAERQNERFFHWASRRRPFVLAKWAGTLDGRIASSRGESRWITSEAARHRALQLREEYDAVLVGARTLAADDPRLTRRLGENAQPHRRIVLDGELSAPLSSRLYRRPEGVIVATARPLSDPRARRLARRGVEVWSLPSRRRGRVSLRRLLARLGRDGVTGLLVEGGGEAHWSFLAEGLVDRVLILLAPRILGGAKAVPAVGGKGFPLARTPRLEGIEIEVLGQDLLLTGRVAR